MSNMHTGGNVPPAKEQGKNTQPRCNNITRPNARVMYFGDWGVSHQEFIVFTDPPNGATVVTEYYVV